MFDLNIASLFGFWGPKCYFLQMAELELETTSIGSKMAFAIFLSIIFDMFGVCEILATFSIGFGFGFSPLTQLNLYHYSTATSLHYFTFIF